MGLHPTEHHRKGAPVRATQRLDGLMLYANVAKTAVMHFRGDALRPRSFGSSETPKGLGGGIRTHPAEKSRYALNDSR